MKKIISFGILFVMLFSLSACGRDNTENELSSSTTLQTNESVLEGTEEVGSSSEALDIDSHSVNTESKIVVVYFSCTGNTKAVSEKIAELTGADLYEIVPQIPYTDEDLNYNNDDCRANKEMNDSSARPAIGSENIDVSKYDIVYIGFPIWWGTMPRIINTFLDTYELSGKIIMPFCTSGSSGIFQAVSDIKDQVPDAVVKDGLRASWTDDSEMTKWIENSGIQ